METLTQTAESEQSPDSFLAQGLRSLPGIDTTGYPEADKSDVNPTLKTDTQDRGTAEPDATQQADTQVSDKSSTSTSDAEQPTAVVGKGRKQDRIQELLAQVKERDAKLAEYEKAKTTQSVAPKTVEAQKPADVPQMVPKPEYEVKTLQALRDKYEDALEEHRINGDLVKIRETRELLRSIDVKMEEAKTWESRNKAEFEKSQNLTSHYRNELLKQIPEMADEKSPVRQEYNKVHARFVDLQKNPALLEYEMASIANLRVRASKVAVLEEQNKQFQQELASLKDKSKPMTQTEAPSSGSHKENEDPQEELRRGLKNLNIQRFQ